MLSAVSGFAAAVIDNVRLIGPRDHLYFLNGIDNNFLCVIETYEEEICLSRELKEQRIEGIDASQLAPLDK